MAQVLPFGSATCCCRRAVKFAWSRPAQRRSMLSLHAGPVERLNFPPQLPEQYWSQLPKRMRPEQGRLMEAEEVDEALTLGSKTRDQNTREPTIGMETMQRASQACRPAADGHTRPDRRASPIVRP